MNKFRLFLIGVLSILMVGCMTHHNTPAQQSNVRLCKEACYKQQATCAKRCNNSCRNCTAASNHAMARHYGNYVRQQYVQGGLIAREPNSYRDPLLCLKTTCDCRADLAQCLQACTGTLQQHYKMVPTCC